MTEKKKCPKCNQNLPVSRFAMKNDRRVYKTCEGCRGAAMSRIRHPQTLLNSPLDWGRHRLKVTPEIRRTGETFDGGIMIKHLGNHDYEKIGYSLS